MATKTTYTASGTPGWHFVTTTVGDDEDNITFPARTISAAFHAVTGDIVVADVTGVISATHYWTIAEGKYEAINARLDGSTWFFDSSTSPYVIEIRYLVGTGS